jgi:hypothetical protein
MQVVQTPAPLTEQQTIDAIEKFINAPPPNSRIYTITPEVAVWIIDTFNEENRPEKPGKIRLFKNDMAAGKWGVTGDTLKFSDKGRLRDGQNRLYACIAAEKPFTTHVVFGIDDKLFDVMDRGKNRDSADVLAIAGIEYPRSVAQAITWAYKLGSNPKSRDALEPRIALDLYKRHYKGKKIDFWVGEARDIHKAVGHPTGLVAGLLWHIAQKNGEAPALKFATAWKQGNREGQPRRRNNSIDGMIVALQDHRKLTQGRIHDTMRAAWAVLAWNAFKQGKVLTKSAFKWTPQDDFPDIA